MSHGWRPMEAILLSGLLVAAVLCLPGCSFIGPASTNLERVRAEALSALENAAAWKITLQDNTGVTYTDWWSSNCPYYRWDCSLGQSAAVDGATYAECGTNGCIKTRPLVTDAGHPTNPTIFSTYYWYLRQGRPITVSGPAGDPATVRVVLKDAPSALSVQLAADSYLPVALDTRSEETGQQAHLSWSAVPITVAELKEVVEQLIPTSGSSSSSVPPATTALQ